MAAHVKNTNMFRMRLTPWIIGFLILVAFTGCNTTQPGSQRNVVTSELTSRVGSGIGPGGGMQCGSIPAGVNVQDGLTDDEVVALALWNNADYHQMLAQLGVSRAQVLDAGLIADPQLVMLLPVGPKQFEFTAFQAIDAIWLRPIRKRAAELDLCQLAQQMVQNGLDTVRTARVAHANLLLAQDRARLSEELNILRTQIAEFAKNRLDAGDISELEYKSSQIEALQAQAAAAQAKQDVYLAQEEVRTLVGIPIERSRILGIGHEEVGLPVADNKDLVATAWAMRPDIRAVEIQATAARKRVEVARNQFMLLDAGVDANSDGEEGFEASPALRMTLPLWNRNQGGIAIAEEQLKQVNHQYAALRDRVELEVRTSLVQLEQADEQRRLVDENILPALSEAEELARRNYENGGVPYFLVLQTTGQYVDAKIRRAEATAGVRRAIAELERSVGRKVARQSKNTVRNRVMTRQIAPRIGEQASKLIR